MSPTVMDDLSWVAEILWPAREHVRVRRGSRVAAGFRRVESYLALPRPNRPRFLVPTRRRVRRAALWQFNASMGALARLRKASAALLLPLVPDPPTARIHIDVAQDLDARDLPAVLLEHRLAAALAVPSASCTISFGSLRPNRKPVLQITDAEGSPLAYAKVAWNDLTRGLVEREVDALRDWAEEPPQTFRVPRLLAVETWAGWPVAVTEAAQHRLRSPRLRASDAPVLEAVRELGRRKMTDPCPLAEIPMWKDLRARVDAIRDPERRATLQIAADRFQAWAGDVVHRAGSWHGDWAPWNMVLAPTGLFVWDWERSRDGVPLGLDVVHLVFQIALHATGRRPMEAVRRAMTGLGPMLEAAGVSAAGTLPLLAFYLFELLLRYEDAVEAGALPATDPVREGAPAALSSLMEARPA